MGLLDSIVSAMGAQNPQAAEQAALLPALVEQVRAYPGGLPALVEKFQQGGLGGAVASWMGAQQNEPVTPEQLRPVLGESLLNKLAQGSGLDTDLVLSNLSIMLPSLVDQLTPNGQDSAEGLGASLLDSMSGMLGKR